MSWPPNRPADSNDTDALCTSGQVFLRLVGHDSIVQRAVDDPQAGGIEPPSVDVGATIQCVTAHLLGQDAVDGPGQRDISPAQFSNRPTEPETAAMAAMIDRDVSVRHVPVHKCLFVGRKVSIRARWPSRPIVARDSDEASCRSRKTSSTSEGDGDGLAPTARR